jgi:3-hydroxyacyl-CoA dehydrogenase
MMAAGQKNWEQIRDMVAGFQEAVMKLRYSSIPVVAAPYQMTVGGGMELCLAANGVQAAAETYAGQVEVGVGLIPGGAGNVNLLWRALEAIPDGAEIDPYAIVTQVFKNIAMANMAFSAGAAIEMGYFPRDTGISFDRARHLHEAKQRAVGMAESGFHPPARRAFRLPGASGIATLSMMVNTLVAGGYASEHDALIANKLAHVLCGGEGGAAREVTEDEMLELEREAFVSLCGEKKSIERMGHMLMKNKPLRN